MEEKIFDLMTKMYAEMQDMKSEMQDMKREINEVKGIQIRMEQNLTQKIDALFDAREVQIDVDEMNK